MNLYLVTYFGADFNEAGPWPERAVVCADDEHMAEYYAEQVQICVMVKNTTLIGAATDPALRNEVVLVSYRQG